MSLADAPTTNIMHSEEDSGEDEESKNSTKTAQDTNTKKKLHGLMNWVEDERLKHTLAFEHFVARAFVFMFIPITSITLASGTLSLYSTSKFVEDDEEDPTKNDQIEFGSINIDLVFFAGLLSLFTTFLNALQDKLNFRGRAEMHKSASLQLKKMSFELASLDVENWSPASKEVLGAKIAILERSFMEIQNSCTSVVPSEINEAFNLLENRAKTKFRRDKRVPEIYDEESKFYFMAGNELSGAISSYKVLGIGPSFFFGFPLFLPAPTASANTALKNIDKAIVDHTNTNDDSVSQVPKSSQLSLETFGKC
jgi:hypothetical protein